MSKDKQVAKAPSQLLLLSWLPILLVTGIGLQVTDATTLWVVHLVIPIAALLGSRYGSRGLAVVALGGLPLLLQWRYAALFGGACLDIYLVSLIVCKLAGSPWPRLQPPSRTVCCLAFLLLPLSIGFYGSDSGEFTWQLVLVFEALFYLFLFLAGAAGFSARRIGAMLAGFTVFGMVLELLRVPQDAQQLVGGSYAELPLLGYTELRTLWMEYGLDSPAQLLTALGWYFVGTHVASLDAHSTKRMTAWHQTWLPVVLLALEGIGWEANSYLATWLTGSEPSSAFMLLGSFYALPCAALLAGLLLQWRGILLVLAMLLAFFMLDGLIRAEFDLLNVQFFFDLRDPAAVLGFGVLGIGLRNRLLGAAEVLWSWQWTSYIVIVAVLLPVLFSVESLLDFLWMILSAIGAIVIGKWLALLRERYLGWLPTHGGWLALLWLLAFLFIAARNVDVIAQMGAVVQEWITANAGSLRAGEGWYEPDGEEFTALLILAGGFVLFFSILKRFLHDAPSCGRDLRALIGILKGKRQVAELAVMPQPDQQIPDSVWSRIGKFASSSAAVLRNVAAGILLAFLLVQTGITFYPQDGMIAMVREWFAPEAEVFDDFDGDIAATNPPINPYFWQAVREAYSEIPGTVNEREGTLETEWFNDAGEPDVRQRIAISVGEMLESYDLSVKLRLQRKGLLGLWIEQDRYWDSRKQDFVGVDTYVQQQEIADRLLARARELASSRTDQ
jgi:hypothetical protein